MNDDHDDITAGSLVGGRFSLGPSIGRGSFGIVYRAMDSDPGDGPRLVALKTLRRKTFGMPELVQRFDREIEICATLVHPNIARMITYGKVDVGTLKDVPYIVMELIRGLPLGGLASMRGTLTVRETAHILASVLDGLHAAHQQGILHRDLKPNNILIEAPASALVEPGDGEDLFQRLGVPGRDAEVWNDLEKLDVKVVDFGLGKMLETGGKKAKKLTKAGVAAGTAEYMAPEQVRAPQEIDHRADIYGVAMLAYRLLTGEAAHQGKTVFEVASKQIRDPLPALPGGLAGHPIAEVYRKAGSKQRDGRYASAREMSMALRQAALVELGSVPPVTVQPPPAPRKRGFFARLFRR